MLTNSWLDPSQVGNYQREATLEIRTSLSIQDTPIGVPGATDPSPEDLIPHYEEYRFQVGDALSIRVFELVARNTETAAQVAIDELGTITIPVLGDVHVLGMTRNEIREELKKLVAERGYVQDATIIVEPLVRRGQSFIIFGATSAPNLYPIPSPNTRLLEVLNTSGGFFDTVTDIYVMREQRLDPDLDSVMGAGPRRPSRRMVASAQPVSLSDVGGRSGGIRLASAADDPEPGATPAPDAENELREAVQPPATGPAAAPAPTPTPTAPPAAEQDLAAGQQPNQPRWIFLNGEWIETTEPAPATAPEAPAGLTPPAPLQLTPPPANLPGPAGTVPADLDWTRLAGDTETRVIHVSAQALRDGDPRQNIVVRGGDTIRVLAGQTGEYYMGGNVFRPGAYSITGRQITLKTAIASAGNLAPLAWPDRCTIYRRYGDREEMHQVNLAAIFAGKEPDVLLKNNDLVMVGTHPIAPFLAVIRNAFRLTYGFGFVYDRNFADIDQYGPKINPDNLQGSTNRFPNIFR